MTSFKCLYWVIESWNVGKKRYYPLFVYATLREAKPIFSKYRKIDSTVRLSSFLRADL